MQCKHYSLLSSFFILTSLSTISCADGVIPTVPCNDAATWSRFSLGAGAGMGAWTADSKVTEDGHAITATQKQGGDGGFIAASVGYDYLFKYSLLVGAFVDGTYGRLSGTSAFPGVVGDQSVTGTLGLGARFGRLISPTILPYLTAGFTRAYFDHVNFNLAIAGGTSTGLSTPAFAATGAFLGAGLEVQVYNNWFLRGEYRYGSYNRQSVNLNGASGGELLVPNNIKLPFNPTVQTFEALIVYKLNP